MRVFNLAEELEKERKKNKELEEKRRKDNYFIGGLSREIKELQENIKIALEMCKERQDRIDKAIEYINKLTTHHESYDYDIDYDYKKEIIDILKGDNNE